jgi:hypothetical protein
LGRDGEHEKYADDKGVDGLHSFTSPSELCFGRKTMIGEEGG